MLTGPCFLSPEAEEQMLIKWTSLMALYDCTRVERGDDVAATGEVQGTWLHTNPNP